jgi:hypothetical protein
MCRWYLKRLSDKINRTVSWYNDSAVRSLLSKPNMESNDGFHDPSSINNTNRVWFVMYGKYSSTKRIALSNSSLFSRLTQLEFSENSHIITAYISLRWQYNVKLFITDPVKIRYMPILSIRSNEFICLLYRRCRICASFLLISWSLW